MRSLKKIIRQSDYLSKLFKVYRLFIKEEENFEKVQDSKLITLTNKNEAVFFGYHDKTPFSANGKYLLANSVSADDKTINSECTLMKLGYFKVQESNYQNKFIQFSETKTWSWQQGAMLQWNPEKPNSQIIYNDLVNGQYGAKVFDLEKNEIIKSYNAPIYSISPNGKFA